MIEKVTVEMTRKDQFSPVNGPSCDRMNPKELLLYAAAQCSGQTVMHLLDKMRIMPRRLEISYSGELDTEQLQAESRFRSFHVIYNVACGEGIEQERVSRAIALAHERYCGLTQMLRRIAPITSEAAIVSVEPEPAEA